MSGAPFGSCGCKGWEIFLCVKGLIQSLAYGKLSVVIVVSLTRKMRETYIISNSIS